MKLSENLVLCILVYLVALKPIVVNMSDDSKSKCFCSLESSPYEKGIIELLTCQRDDIVNYKPQIMIQCQQIDDLVRIGPLLSKNLPQSHPNNEIAEINLAVANWGFADLMKNSSIRRLQLSLDIERNSVDAVAMAGLESLEELLARTSKVYWDSCSLANMIRLKQATLNCQSTFNNYLTFSSELETLRFVNCEGVALQFHCVTCMQDTRIKVIRIRPGPLLNSFMVRFNNMKNVSLTDSVDRLPVGYCIPGVCSDEMMCRNNVPLQTARHQFTAIGNSSNSDNLSSAQSRSQVNTPAVAGEESVNIGGTDSIDKLHHNRLRPIYGRALPNPSGQLRYWIVTAILAVTLAFLVTICVLISLYRHRLQPQKVSVAWKNRSELLRLNAEKSAPAVSADTLSLPDVI